MPLTAPSGPRVTGYLAPCEISQGVREIGSRASFLGVTRRWDTNGATQGTADRWARVRNERAWDLSEQVIGACIEVHRVLGPGLLESIYEEALCAELQLRSIPFDRQRQLPVVYKGKRLNQVYRADLIVGDELLIEVKSVESILFVHVAQAVTYLRVTGVRSGLIVNFNAALMRDGLRRVSLTPHPSQGSRSPDLPVKKSEPPHFRGSSFQTAPSAVSHRSSHE